MAAHLSSKVLDNLATSGTQIEYVAHIDRAVLINGSKRQSMSCNRRMDLPSQACFNSSSWQNLTGSISSGIKRRTSRIYYLCFGGAAIPCN
ncbi:hypothetical protein DOTSEDRAFT_75221 [Dothistroma septosporum NZE10]|uniref:Uncharacterized protein n=1 Tax=Dothistroma septosporum (strain NZE10 / CBS 128990) TaxID=675120 RepID=M2XJ48_DOTSN|nr:hypothetical protein DOTSEDRAFT_75221 [Dothistroma septosporum NZE10]